MVGFFLHIGYFLEILTNSFLTQYIKDERVKILSHTLIILMKRRLCRLIEKSHRLGFGNLGGLEFKTSILPVISGTPLHTLCLA